MIIRKANPSDVHKISYLIRKNTEMVKENNYTADQIRVWKKYNSPSGIVKQMKNRIIFYSFENNRLVGTIGLQNDEIVGLYISYHQRKKGLGHLFLQYLEKFARENNMNTLILTSTPSAEKFYINNGYKSVGKVVIEVEGIPFSEIKMIKCL